MLDLQTFARAANQEFDLAIGEGTMTLTLVEAAPLPVHPYPGMLRAPFSLVFRSTKGVILPQRLYRVEHADIGAVDLFLVPVGRDVAGVLYQAVFN